jgi:D-xylose 1-dehydrogenase (NADP+, D-xylono-1,5-lactone-forming)
MGGADIADRAMIPALKSAHGCEVVALASRDADRRRAVAEGHGIPRVHSDYAELLADPAVDAVYLPLPNSLHLPWVLRALAAGKHVLCEKPLALNATEAEEMAAAARAAGRLLMEAFMYRFHPSMLELVQSLADAQIRHLYASFSFPLNAPGNYRLRGDLGGGALLDVGCYLVDVAQWLLGEPERVEAVSRREGVDMSWSVLLGYDAGAQAALYASFEAPEYQELVVVCSDDIVRRSRPFTSWRDPDDPYRLMVEAFARAVEAGSAAPIPLETSIGNLRLLDRIRHAAG